MMATRIHEVILLPDFGPPVDDVEPQEPQHFGLLQIQLRALGIPEARLNDEPARRHARTPTGLARPGKPTCGHLRGGLQTVLVRDQEWRNEKAGQAARKRFLEPLDHGALVRRRGQLDHDLPRGAGRTGDEVDGDVGKLGDTAGAAELAMQLGPGVFPEVEPVRERSAAHTLAVIAVGPGRQDRRRETPWLDVDVTPDLNVVARLGGLQQLEAYEDPASWRRTRKDYRCQKQREHAPYSPAA